MDSRLHPPQSSRRLGFCETSRQCWSLEPAGARIHAPTPRFADVYAKTACPAIPPEQLLRARRTGYSAPAYWEKVDRATWDDLLGMEDPQGPLGMDAPSTSKGCTDPVPLSLTQDISSSLCLLQVDGLTLSVFKPGEDFGNPKPLRNTPIAPVRHYGFQRSHQHSE